MQKKLKQRGSPVTNGINFLKVKKTHMIPSTNTSYLKPQDDSGIQSDSPLPFNL